ncbi:MAG: SPOR domain-containing protein [Hyphomicrobiales bacterium]
MSDVPETDRKHSNHARTRNWRERVGLVDTPKAEQDAAMTANTMHPPSASSSPSASGATPSGGRDTPYLKRMRGGAQNGFDGSEDLPRQQGLYGPFHQRVNSFKRSRTPGGGVVHDGVPAWHWQNDKHSGNTRLGSGIAGGNLNDKLSALAANPRRRFPDAGGASGKDLDSDGGREGGATLRRRRAAILALGLLVGLAIVISAIVYFLFSEGQQTGDNTIPVIRMPEEPSGVKPENPPVQSVESLHRKLIYDRILAEKKPQSERIISHSEEPLPPPGNKSLASSLPPAQSERFPSLPEAVLPLPPLPEFTGKSILKPESGADKIGGGRLGDNNGSSSIQAPTAASPRTIPEETDSQKVGREQNGMRRQVVATVSGAAGNGNTKTFAAAQRKATMRQTASPRITTPPLPEPRPRNLPYSLAYIIPGKATNGDYAIQISSYHDETNAWVEFYRLQQRYHGFLGSYSAMIKPVDLGQKGRFFRLRIGPIASRGEAERLCSALIASGEKECLVRRRQ